MAKEEVKKEEVVVKKEVCCPEFKSKPWNEREISWNGKFFVKEKVLTFFYRPLNRGSILKKLNKKIAAAGAKTKRPLVVLDNTNPFYSNLYVEVTKPIVGCKDVKLTANFLSKVFEGPSKNMRKWVKEMGEYVKSKGKVTKKNYFFYPTCPDCTKKSGRNYIVILAEI